MSTPTLTEIYRDMLVNSGVPAKTVALNLRKSYTTLLRELNPDDDGCKFGVDLQAEIMRQCNDVSPLRQLAYEVGFRIVPMHNVQPDKENLCEELLDDLPALASYHKSMMENESLESVNRKMHQAINELEVNFVLYRRGMLRKAG
ncbi:phage regulatory CII family protein [Pseudodesulfovibrio karagichevae]|uniref:Phage regulatory CII family protein n=1 Tax=Pseudodesulfovibrio karagichevae TaxID=3239305 RepID=A0ABV4JXI4_9BACT